MIAFVNNEKQKPQPKWRPPRRESTKPVRPAWHDRYLQILPDIRRQACMRLRNLRGDIQEDAIQEVVADTVVAYARLVELGREELAYPTPLANYAVRKFRSGRRVGSSVNVRDVTSPACRNRNRLVIDRLDEQGRIAGRWEDYLIEDRQATPAEIAATRLDFRAWLESLASQTRQIAERLATGESTYNVAKVFRLSPGRISQIRRALREEWLRFIAQDAVAFPCK